jgi:hypothetical protein
VYNLDCRRDFVEGSAWGSVTSVFFVSPRAISWRSGWNGPVAGRTVCAVTLLFRLAGYMHAAYLLARHARVAALVELDARLAAGSRVAGRSLLLVLSSLQRVCRWDCFCSRGADSHQVHVCRGDVPTALYVPDQAVENEALRRWAMLHASLLVFGMSGVIVGFVLSLMYLVQHHVLKRKQTLHAGLTLPSLARLARLNWWAIVLSVPLLTLGMLSGVRLIFLSRSAPNPISWGDPIVVASGVVWLVMMAFFCWMVWTPRPAGKQVAWLTLWACGFLLVTVLGLQMLTGGHETTSDSGRSDRPAVETLNTRVKVSSGAMPYVHARSLA